MRTFRWRRVSAGWAVAAWMAAAAAQPARAAQDAPAFRWQAAYGGEAATGTVVAGFWNFQAGAETRDASGTGAALRLRGRARFTAGGRFGAGLECQGADGRDLRSGAETASKPALSPDGPFTLELWINPGAGLREPAVKVAWLVDKMYIDYPHADPAHERMRDYSLALRAAGGGRHTLQAVLGFGEGVARFASRPLTFETNVWTHLAFVYDGAGTGRLYRDGVRVGEQRHPERARIAPGNYPLVIGDRVNSSFNGFPGCIDEVRLTAAALPFASESVALEPEGRRVFQRMEPGPRMIWRLLNNRDAPLSNAWLAVAVEGAGRQRVKLPVLRPGVPRPIPIKPFSCALRPADYTMRAWVETADGQPLPGEARVTLTLTPRPAPGGMPVVMWGRLNADDEAGFALRRETGFTHSFGGEPVTYPQIWRAGKPTDPASASLMAEYLRLLDTALRHGHAIFAYPLGPASWLGRTHPEFQRVGRGGRPYANPRTASNPCGQSPGITGFCYNVGASIARAYGGHPALQAALIHTEVRDASQFCFHDWDRDACRAATGRDIPDGIHDKYGLHYRTLAGFPADHVIADDDPLMAGFRWFWKAGDGWNAAHSAVHRGLKSTGRQDLWTWYDPAVRTPSVWGSGGEVDVIAHWSYAYPDPVRVAQSTDELFAMAEGAARPPRVMKMTQAIWYRSQTAPKPKAGDPAPLKQAAWERTDGDADFITMAPDALRIAFWTKIARPVQGIMYHDWPALADTGKRGGYRFTHPGARPALEALVRTVVQPLGPALMRIPDRPADVGFLQSFTSQMLAGYYSWGWNDNDDYLTLLYAQLQPRILYEETVMRDGLDGFKVMVLSQCDVLPRGVAERIRAFQRRGGLVVADERVAPAIVPDIRLPAFLRTRHADADKAAIQARAAALRAALDPFYRRYADASDPDVIVRVRQAGTTDYLFAVNDRRTFGDYVGHHGLVMEQGLPHAATLSLARPAGQVYDLVAGRPVNATVAGGRLAIARGFDPAGGAILMVTEQPIGGVRIQAPAAARLGAAAEARIAVVDASGRAMDAIIPVRVAIADAAGQPVEFSGWYGVGPEGLTLRLDLAVNEPPGAWSIRATELASGKTAVQTWVVNR